jgi:hypothetical protein
MSNVEARLRRLEDVEAIRTLKARYCSFADRGFSGAGHDDEAFAALFTEDGVFEASAGALRGRQAIRERCRSFHPLSMHLVTNPEIEVDGDRARAAWSAYVPTATADGRALVVAGRYEERLVRTAEGWRYEYVGFTPAFRSPYEDGWAKTRFASAEVRPA